MGTLVAGLLMIGFLLVAVLTLVSMKRSERQPAEPGVSGTPPQSGWWQQLSHVHKIIVVLGIGCSVLIAVSGYGIYYLATSESRTESAAVQQLVSRAAISRYASQRRTETIKLTNGHWARHYTTVHDLKWDIEKNNSSNYPFVATITVELKHYATVSHHTDVEAERDNNFYRYDGKVFYAHPNQYYSDHLPPDKVTEKLLYDRNENSWMTQGTERK